MQKLFFIIGLAAIFSSCTKGTLHGTGDKKVEIRNVQTFDVVHISGNREAEIIKSDKWMVELSGYANLLLHYDARVSNGNIYFEFPNHTNVTNDNIKLKIYTPSIATITQSGNTKMKVSAGFTGNELGVFLSGSSRFEMDRNIYNRVRIEGSGNTRIYARSAEVKRVDLFLSGLAEAEVFASEQLKVDASGKSKVKYWGEPIATDIRTSGDVKVERQLQTIWVSVDYHPTAIVCSPGWFCLWPIPIP